MSGQLTNHPDALRLFFTEDIYVVPEPSARAEVRPVAAPAAAQGTTDPAPVVEAAIVAEAQYQTFSSLGKNQKNILILVNDAANKVSTEKGSELLRKIVKAIGLSANDFALVNYAQYPGATYQQLRTFFSSKLVFCFGVPASDLQLEQRAPNEINQMANEQLIMCANLDQLDDDQQSKKVLWGNLQKLHL